MGVASFSVVRALCDLWGFRRWPRSQPRAGAAPWGQHGEGWLRRHATPPGHLDLACLSDSASCIQSACHLLKSLVFPNQRKCHLCGALPNPPRGTVRCVCTRYLFQQTLASLGLTLTFLLRQSLCCRPAPEHLWVRMCLFPALRASSLSCQGHSLPFMPT